jgi:hypothetical protein
MAPALHALDKPLDHMSFLLRLWRAGDEQTPVWRASLKRSHTGEWIGFAGIEDLYDYLRIQINEIPSVSAGTE